MFWGSQLQVALLAWARSHTKCPSSLSHPLLLGLCILFQICQMVGVSERLHFSLPGAFPFFLLPTAEQGSVPIHDKKEIPSLKRGSFWTIHSCSICLSSNWDLIFSTGSLLPFFPVSIGDGNGFFSLAHCEGLLGWQAVLTCDFYYAVYWEIQILLLPLPYLLVQNEYLRFLDVLQEVLPSYCLLAF